MIIQLLVLCSSAYHTACTPTSRLGLSAIYSLFLSFLCGICVVFGGIFEQDSLSNLLPTHSYTYVYITEHTLLTIQ